MSSTLYVQYTLRPVHFMSSTLYVQYTLRPVHFTSSALYVQYTLCPVHFLSSALYVQYTFSVGLKFFSDIKENNNPPEIVCYMQVSELVLLRNDAQNKGLEGIFGTSFTVHSDSFCAPCLFPAWSHPARNTSPAL
jgi:hypothetical protein